MKILTVENEVYEIDQVPDEVDDIRFGVFDTSDPEWMDYYFLPLIFLESFYAPAICLQIGEHKFKFHKASLRFFNYAAKKLNIHRLQINVSRYNYLAYKWALACYFLEEGILKEYGPDKSDYFMMSRLFGKTKKE